MGKNSVLILGIGNPIRKDDGIGPAIITHLQNSREYNHVDFLDGGTDGLSLIEYIKDYKKVIIIDAVDMGASPGDIRLFSPDEVKLNIITESLSTHGFGLAEVIDLIKKLGIKVDLKIIGIQPKDISLGQGLNKEISAKIGEIIDIVRHSIN
ncbi:MAG: hydrogenase maturation protease [Spirochaetes bacterium]|nr:hydrogenase maturation protease [Spirochaetota bacterium]